MLDYAEFVPQMKLSPRTHQLEAFDFAYPKSGTLLAIEMGGGKTMVTLMLQEAWGAKNTLVVCPKHVIPVWEAEARKHLPRPPFILPCVKGTVAARAKQAHKFRLAHGRSGYMLIINYESVWRNDFAKFLLKHPWDLVICDESHRIKSHDSKVSVFMHHLRPKTKRRLCLTGTPNFHSQLDFFGQARFLDPDIFGWSYHRFARRFAKYRPMEVITKGGKPKKIQVICGYQNEEELKKVTSKFTYRPESIDKSTWPEYRHETFYCQMPKSARDLYLSLKHELMAEVDDGTVTAFNSLTATLRLRQIAAGHVPFDEDEDGEVRTIHREKAKLLKEYLTDVDTPVAVFCHWRHDCEEIRRVAEELGRTYGEVSGRRHDLEGGEYPAGVDVLALQYRSGGSGVNLQNRCHRAVFYTPTYSAGDYSQALRRVWREGQTHGVVFTHLLTQDSLEEVVHKALLDRTEVNTALINSLATGG